MVLNSETSIGTERVRVGRKSRNEVIFPSNTAGGCGAHPFKHMCIVFILTLRKQKTRQIQKDGVNMFTHVYMHMLTLMTCML